MSQNHEHLNDHQIDTLIKEKLNPMFTEEITQADFSPVLKEKIFFSLNKASDSIANDSTKNNKSIIKDFLRFLDYELEIPITAVAATVILILYPAFYLGQQLNSFWHSSPKESSLPMQLIYQAGGLHKVHISNLNGGNPNESNQS
ncbi:MAG: hypothetical protein SCK28_05950 [Bacillota bacterium]|nr:hypothetical protein [Bacillota bacterium]